MHQLYHVRIISKKGAKDIGIDAISVYPVGSEAFNNHRLIFAHDAIIIENFCNLDKTKTATFGITLMPLKKVASDGIVPGRWLVCRD